MDRERKTKKARRGRIFIDYLRNGRGATAVAAYSTRALPLASVSTPLAWEELTQGVRADHFKVGNLRQRLDVLRDDPWPDFFTLRQRLPIETEATSQPKRMRSSRPPRRG